MTGRQRLLAALRHERADRLPWAPKFATWLAAHLRRGEIPAVFEGCSHWYEAARRIGVDIFDKSGKVWREVHHSVRIEEETRDAFTITRSITPIGELRSVREQVDDYAHTVYLTEHPIKTPEDLRIWRYLLDDTTYEPCYDEYLRVDREIGDDGITMSDFPDSPLHRVFVTLMGYQTGSYAFADMPDAMGELCEAILEKNEKAYDIAMRSPAEVLLTGENTNSDFESPTLFRRWALPAWKRASQLAHAHGKLHWVHACGKIKVLLPQFREAGIDGVESLTPPPYADTNLWEARASWDGAITIDGGISPHLLVGEVSDERIEREVLELFGQMGSGSNFVLSVSDDTPTDARIERLAFIGSLVREHGALPLAAPSV
jgi:hypothetical protein